MKRTLRLLRRITLLLIGPIAIACVGAYFYLTGGRIVSTENAYIKAEKIAVSTDINGRVTTVAVKDNQRVKLGELLFEIDQEPFVIARDKAVANAARVAAEIEALRADYRQKLAEITLARGDLNYYEREFNRRKKLQDRGHVSISKLDEARRDMEAARQRIAAIQQEIARVRASLGGNPNSNTTDHPRYREAMAARDEAELDLRRTKIFAPTSGIVTNIELQPGEYVRAGTPIFSLVGNEAIWVQANLKETDLTYVQIGQTAQVRVDAYPNQTWTATVASISPATGAEFAVLPPQNTSGNWVKVVQRIPVQLSIQRQQANGPALRAGMSVIVDIDTKHERELPGIVASALAFVQGSKPASVSK